MTSVKENVEVKFYMCHSRKCSMGQSPQSIRKDCFKKLRRFGSNSFTYFYDADLSFYSQNAHSDGQVVSALNYICHIKYSLSPP